MKTNATKWLAVILCICLVMGLAAGCNREGSGGNNSSNNGTPSGGGNNSGSGSGNSSGNEDLDYVELKMWLVGDKPEGFDDVYAEVNKILKEKVNATVKVDWLSWADEGTNYPLLFSGGDDFDMIFTASSWGHFEQTVGLGGFLALEPEFIQKYAPDVWAVEPEAAWTQATIDGNIYMLPANFIEVTPDVVAIRGDLMKKYGFDDIASYDQLLDFYKACADDGIYGNSVGSSSVIWLWAESNGLRYVSGAPDAGVLIQYYANDPNNLELDYLLDDPKFTQFCYDMKELADAGCWPSDVLSTTQDRQDGLLSGRGASMVWNHMTCQIYANQANAEHPDWDINIYNIMPEQKYAATKYINGGIGINAASKNPERALMVYNLFATDQDIQDLTQLGIKGVNWEETDDGRYQIIEGKAYNTSNNWGWRNLNIMRTEYQANPSAVDTKVNELAQYFLDNVKPDHPLDNFAFDTTSVSTQFAAVEAAMGTYFDPLINGLVDDVDTTLAQFRSALESAGIQDLLTELQRQVDEFVAK